MSAFNSTRSNASHAGFGTLFARVFAAFSAWNERRATRAALSRLSDRELDDIGLSRGDIDLVARQI